jgi:predicted transcriptional regulator
VSGYEPLAFGAAVAASDLTTTSKITALVLAVFADPKTGEVSMRQVDMMAATSQSQPTVSRAIGHLIEAGFVNAPNGRASAGRGAGNLYQLRIASPTADMDAAEAVLEKLEKYDMAVALGLIED